MSEQSAPGAAPLGSRLGEFGAAVDALMRARIDGADLPHELVGMLRYHLGWVDERFQPISAAGGKHVRPALCLLACEAAGGDWRAALASAAAVEMIHNFSLIHDDIEDVSPQRRHRPTVWALWGVPLAVNTGDALLIEAQLALQAGEGPPEQRLAAVELLGRACRSLCTGQHLDLDTSPAAPSLAGYYAMIGGKTAALLACAAELGALAGGADTRQRAAYRRFGRELGLAFQVQDDLLDVWGATERMGKPAREDLRYLKRSFPIAYVYEHAAPAQRDLLERLYGSEPPLPEDAIDSIVGVLDSLDVRAEGERQVRQHHAAALDALAEARPVPAPGALLVALAKGLLGRDA